ncbi:MAG: phosphosulfolactate synthase [Bacteroidales bacterium]|jgi:phosphosulfolactate synthase|nr:phosphosulfolactate synthase [Bacteroidales bacterium]
MNIKLPFIPERTEKPRENGITMMMDKGLSIREAECFVESAGEFTDLVKLAFGTGIFAKSIDDKIRLYRQAGIHAYFGGTLFEAFIVRGQFDEFRRFIDRYHVDMAEISDGSIAFPHEKKLEYIRILSQQVTVLSEVGSKIKGVVLEPEMWAQYMKSERQAGSWKVIAEARESGTIGIYRSDGTANKRLINLLGQEVGNENILWEAPNKNQQAWFIKKYGANVNVGNIATGEVVSLETLRLGLRSDTFFEFLPENLHCFKQME